MQGDKQIQGIRCNQQNACRSMDGVSYCTGGGDQSHPPKKRSQKRQNGGLGRPYKWLGKEEKQKVKEKMNDIPI